MGSKMMDTLMEADGHVRILVVDDEEIVRDMLFDVLSPGWLHSENGKRW